MSVDTLRYYEKLGLLPPVTRNASGLRMFGDQDISRLKFIQRAQKMNFTLAEIGDLLHMREDPQHARDEVRAVAAKKLVEIEEHVGELEILRRELQLLISLCRGAKDGCPIIEEIEKDRPPAADVSTSGRLRSARAPAQRSKNPRTP